MSANDTLGTMGNLRSALTGSGGTKPEAVVGVHIDATCIRVAVVSNSRLVLHKRYPITESVDFTSAKFAPVLRKIMDEACSGQRRIDIWAAAPIQDTHLYHIRIPKVPASRIGSAAQWAVGKDRPYDKKTTVFDMDIEGEVVEDGVSKISITAYTMPKEAVHSLQNVFRSIGYPVAGITLPFFALRNLFKSSRIAPSAETVLHMHVGFNYSRISLFSKGNVILGRGFKTGFSALLGAVSDDSVSAPSPMQARTLLNSLNSAQSTSSTDGKMHPDQNGNVLMMIQPVLIRMVRQIEQTLASQIARQNIMEDKTLYISGEICRHPAIIEFIRGHVGIGIKIIDPLKSDRSINGESDSDAVMFAPAVGLALSEASRTPNAISTHEERLLVRKSDNFVRLALVAMIVVAIGMAGAAHLIRGVTKKKEGENAKLRKELSSTGLTLDTKALSDMVIRVGMERKRMEQVVRKTAAVSVLGELSRLTPSRIQLTGIELEMEPPESGDKKKQSGQDHAKVDVLTIKGKVRTGRESPDSVAAAYAVELEKSTIFDEVAVQQSNIRVDARDGVGFIIRVVLASPTQNPGG